MRLASPPTCARRQANTLDKVLEHNQELVILAPVILAPILSPPILSLVPAGDVLDQGVAEPLVLLEVAHVQDGHAPRGRHALAVDKLRVRARLVGLQQRLARRADLKEQFGIGKDGEQQRSGGCYSVQGQELWLVGLRQRLARGANLQMVFGIGMGRRQQRSGGCSTRCNTRPRAL